MKHYAQELFKGIEMSFMSWLSLIEKLWKAASDSQLSDSMKDLVAHFIGKFSSVSGKSPCYNIGFFGPSRIGKTTLTASMVEEFKLFSHKISQSGGSYLKLTAQDQPTKARLSNRINDLKSGIQKGGFATGTLTGTSTHEVFNLRFEEGKEKSFQQDFALHDFPGGWINDPQKIAELNLKSWDVVILPIDAAVVMESKESRRKKAVRSSLCIDQVESFITDWVQMRDHLPGLCIFAPVKCEAYFAEPKISPILSDRHLELYNEVVNSYYKGVIKIIQEASHIDCLYMPVNTIGCCYFKRWADEEDWEGTYVISREPGMNQWKPYGPSYIMLEVCRFIAGQLRRLPNADANDKIASFLQATTDLEKVMHNPECTAPVKPYDRKAILQKGMY